MIKRSTHLFNPGFIGLIVAQFFGAMNDNILKVILTFMVINGAWSGQLGQGGQGVVSICFTVPFMLLSGFAGQIADRFSKQQVTMWVKIAEIPIAAVAGLGFYLQNLPLTLFALTALTCQSSFFGPAKYGMIPELVSDRHLSRANGAINMMTNVAVIAGTLIAGIASDHYATKDDTPGILWLPGALLVATAILGWIASYLIPRLDAGDKNLKIKLNPFSTYIASIREMAQTRLLMVMMAWGYFYMLAGLALFIVPEYTEVLHINHTEASVLMGVLGIAIGLGCAVAGLLSGDQIRPRLTLFGAIGLVLFFFLLAAVPPWMPDTKPLVRVALSNVSLLILLAGFSAGFYIVPLQALLQKLSPDDERGQFLGTANAVSFAFMTVAGVLYPVIRPGFGDAPQRIFFICSGLMLVGAAFFTYRLRGTGILVNTSESQA
ncbi:MFS transporter [Stieleria sp. JC731]|uniref:MFS transporter n=1 Tax=Pirellulaceae TaxID=2691357 RepID=UPI0028F42FB6|nr:MFS transporter [Stieleria sp. JC731]MCC9599695.1 MFS transporter [Stieleria sp. JC731]